MDMYNLENFDFEHKSHGDNYRFNCFALCGGGLHFHLPQSICDARH